MKLPAVFCLLLCVACGSASLRAQDEPNVSGGTLSPEQAAYDITFYDLALRISPADSSIAGTLAATARVGAPLDVFVLDLDRRLSVEAVEEVEGEMRRPLPFVHEAGRLRIDFFQTKQPGEVVTVAVHYGGRPRVAPNPPWDGGFTWARTASGAPWIATTCQQEGADLWWPVKDHPSDEPDSMAVHVTVPAPLVAASNGRLRSVEENADETRTYHWFSSTPVNTYNIALNIAPYHAIEGTFESIAGGAFPVVFYVLPEDRMKGEALFPEILDHLRFYEETLGPYPFRADKYGVAQTPHPGMEHQTIIAYGANFDNGSMTGGVDWGFDALHHHELAHEWWGNLVTNADWSDMWLHEGFGTYMQPLYLEARQGAEVYHAYLASIRPHLNNRLAVAPRGALDSKAIYGGDIYSKGAWVLHTLRYLLGDEAFFAALRRMVYPDPALAQTSDGAAFRFATTDDFVHLVDDLSGRDLDWFFEVYVRQPDLPRLRTDRDDGTLTLCWDAPGDLPFPMPVDVEIDGETLRVEMPAGRATVAVPEGATVEVDPLAWVLREE